MRQFQIFKNCNCVIQKGSTLHLRCSKRRRKICGPKSVVAKTNIFCPCPVKVQDERLIM